MQLQEEISVLLPLSHHPWALASVWALFLHVHPPQVSVASQVKGSESSGCLGHTYLLRLGRGIADPAWVWLKWL